MLKFSLNILERCVYPYTGFDDSSGVLGSNFDVDVALTRVSDEFLISHVDPIVGDVEDIGILAVHVACNDIAT